MLEASSKKLFSTTAIALLLFSSALVIGSAPKAHATSTSVGIVIPLYSYPTSGTWAAAIQAKQAYSNVPFIAVVSANSGPGWTIDSNFVQGVKNLQAAGIKVLGYVDTAYGADSLSTVESNINLWGSWYGVDGIFFDEMNNVPGYESYYSALGSYVSSAGMAISMGNPGTSVPPSYIGTLSILNVYESGGYPPLIFITYPGYSTSNFAVMAYGVPLSTSFLTSAAASTAWVYFTDATMPNPYATLPSYFTSEISALSAIDSAPPPTTSYTVSVNSVSLTGSPIFGMWTTFQESGGSTMTGFTPASFGGTSGGTYTVAVANFGSIVFCHWQDGSTNPSRTLTLQASVSLTAYYSTTGSCAPSTFPVTVVTESTTGAPITGLYALVSHSSTNTAAGFSPLSFTANSGESYTVTVENYGIYTFSHWSDGSTNPTIAVAPSQATTLIAYYNVA